MVDWECGIQVPVGDVSALAEVIATCLSKPMTMRRVGEKAPARAKSKFSNYVFARKVESLYAEIIS